MHCAVIMEPLADITPAKNTSFALLLAAQLRGGACYHINPHDLAIHQGRPMAIASQVKVVDNKQNWFEVIDTKQYALDQFDYIFMRQEPPVNAQYLYNTWVLSLAEQMGTTVVNRPQALRDHNEKCIIFQFPQYIVPTCVSAALETLEAFINEYQDVIVKPLDGMGGQDVYRLRAHTDRNSSILQLLTEGGNKPIMSQRYIPEITQGDKRIILVDGEAIEYCLARIPQMGSVRANLASGGRGVVCALTKRERALCQQVGPWLKQQGIVLAGMDVIGDYITEINITSPTCVREIVQETGIAITDQIFATIEGVS